MSTRHPIKTWDKTDDELMSFFRLNLGHPERGQPAFGSDIRVSELDDARLDTFQSTLGEVGGYAFLGRESKNLTTILNLAYYFKYMAWGIEALRTLSSQDRGAAIDFTRLLLKSGEDRFFHDHVEPLRHHLLQWQIYLYCIPATSHETQMTTGHVVFPVGPMVLCLLPKLPQVAQDRGVSEAKIVPLAGQVMWLVRSTLCPRRKISAEERKDLFEVITAWSKYIPPITMLFELDRMERNNPSLITPELRQAILPTSVRDLLRLPEHPHEE
jgi:hypothetical protein